MIPTNMLKVFESLWETKKGNRKMESRNMEICWH